MMSKNRKSQSLMGSINRFLLTVVTPVKHWPAVDLAMESLERQERMERQNLIIIDLL